MWGKCYDHLLRWCKRWRAHFFGYANEKEIHEIRRLLQAALAEKEKAAEPACDPADLQGEERELYHRILQSTHKHNRNNITRTDAYLDLYTQCPELHWTLLAHMVSRNGGYNMTDLRGELLAPILEAGEAERMFQFLERANFLIFGDAYPQLLLYQASKEKGQPLFHLLPYFRVSRFMRILWERFWRNRDSEMLTLALIVNEQNFIEQRVAQHEKYKPVTQSFEFKAQTYLNLTCVLFPYQAEPSQGNSNSVKSHSAKSNAVAKSKQLHPVQTKETAEAKATATPLHLAGVQVDTFLSLEERIDTGRRLYALLFGRPEVLAGVCRFAKQTPHTGSRADFWPHLFTSKTQQQAKATAKSLPAKKPYRPRIGSDGRLKKGAQPLYSPTLEQAWPDVERPEPPGGTDWCVRAEVAEELYSAKPEPKDITQTYCDLLRLLEKAVAAETTIK